jgi:ubiquinone biosynthesis protein UbiJ
MLASLAVAPLNHLLRGESWARKRLQPYADKTARFRIPPFLDLALVVQSSGEVSTAPAGADNDVTLIASPGLLPRLLAHDESAYGEIGISGDSTFAQEILFIGQNLRWDMEQDLSRLTGDILAHRITRAGENLVHWHSVAAQSLSQSLVEYLTEEQPLLAKPADMRRLVREAGDLQEDVTHLEMRVEALMNRPR